MERDDLFTTIHKGLRHAMFEVGLQAGRTDYADTASVDELRGAWDSLHSALGGHSRHEDEYIFKLLSDREPGGADDLYKDHIRIHADADLIDAQFDRIAGEARTARWRMLGLELYRALQRFTASCLVHFDEEETYLLARIWALCDDREIADARAAFMATIGPEEMQYDVQHMLLAADPQEVEMLEGRIAQLAATA